LKIANVILFHEDPAGIERLINVMYHPHFHFYLHLDKKVDCTPYRHLASKPNVFFVRKRISVRRAGYSQLQAIFSAVEQILESGIEYDFVNLLSGQDYPIKPVNEIYDFLRNHLGKSFLMSETPPSEWWSEAFHRIEKYHFVDYGFPGKYRISNTVSFLMPARKFPLSMQLHGGPNGAYWILNIDAVRYVHAYFKSRNFNQWFFKHTWGSDEFLINTILMNSPLKNQVVNENYHYLDYSEGGSRPKILTYRDFDILKNSHKFFARKFDRRIDESILNKIDEELLFVV
jgi:Core-2/I-Branching enzyme